MSTENSRRKFLKTIAYTAPAIMTFPAVTAHARTGSNYRSPCNNGVGNGGEGCNPGRSPNNDEGFSPGNPGRKGPK